MANNIFTFKRKSQTLTASNSIVLPRNADSFEIFGSSDIELLNPNERENGAQVLLRSRGTVTIISATQLMEHKQIIAPYDNYNEINNSIYLVGGKDYVIPNNTAILLEFNRFSETHGQWVEVSRGVSEEDWVERTYETKNQKIQITYDTSLTPSTLTVEIGETTLGEGGSFSISTGDTAAALKTKIATLECIVSESNVSVSKSTSGTTGTFTIEFIGDLAGQYIPKAKAYPYTQGWAENENNRIEGGNHLKSVETIVPFVLPILSDSDAPEGAIYRSLDDDEKLSYKSSTGVVTLES